MVLKNLKSGKIIAGDLKEAKSIGDLLLGLLNSKNPRSLLFKTRFGIHTLFMKNPITVIILDSEMRVVKMKKDLKPFRFFFWNPKYDSVIELAGTDIAHIETGDILSISR